MKLRALIRRLPRASAAVGVAGFLMLTAAAPAPTLAHGHPVHHQHPGKGHYRRHQHLKHRGPYVHGGHVYVAGTASIGPDGGVLHVGNVVQQVERTIENISALLEAGEASLSDVAAMSVYLRDIADGDRVRASLNSVCRDVPYVMIWAPVCRPTWLVEIEVLAIVSNDDSRWPRY